MDSIAAAIREAREETGLHIQSVSLFGVYSDPTRDPRSHSVSVVFSAKAEGTPQAGDDAADAKVFALEELPETIVFDHRQILEDYRKSKVKS